MSDDITELSKYRCNICNKIYQNYSGLYKHNAKKNSCKKIIENVVTKEIQLQETVKKLLEEKEKERQKLLEKERETLKLVEENIKKETEIIRLRNLMENNFSKDVQEIKEMIVENNQEIKDKINETNPINNYNLTQNNNSNNKSLNFNIKLSAKEKERLDHIPVEQMLCILDQKDFSNSLADLVQAVSFNPKAPENMTWCINDKRNDHGAIEYNSDLNMLMRDSSTSVITKNLQNILFPVTDIFKEIELTQNFTPQQNQNFDRYFNLLGELNIKKEYINSIKERAYDKRGLCKALWDHLEIGIETKKLKYTRSKII